MKRKAILTHIYAKYIIKIYLELKTALTGIIYSGATEK